MRDFGLSCLCGFPMFRFLARYGVRSRDCHRTIFQTTDGRIVYCTAAVGIVLDPITHEQRYFMGHDNDILWFVHFFLFSLLFIYIFLSLSGTMLSMKSLL